MRNGFIFQKTILITFFIFLIFNSIIYAQSNGVVAYYPFDGNANDSSGHGNHGIVHGATLSADRHGNSQSAYYFDGIDDYIDVGNDTSLKPQLPVTFAAWINIDIPSPIDSVSRGTIFTSDFHGSRYFGINISNIQFTDRLIIAYGDGDTIGPSARRSKYIENTPYGDWFHLVGIIRHSTDMTIYINGEDAGGNYSGSGGPIAYDDNPGRIGSIDGSVHGGPMFLKGTLDDLIIFNRELSQTEIDSLYGGCVTISGDSNDDGVVNVLDLLMIADYILGRNPANFHFTNSDINTDSVVNILDIVLIIHIILDN